MINSCEFSLKIAQNRASDKKLVVLTNSSIEFTSKNFFNKPCSFLFKWFVPQCCDKFTSLFPHSLVVKRVKLVGKIFPMNLWSDSGS